MTASEVIRYVTIQRLAGVLFAVSVLFLAALLFKPARMTIATAAPRFIEMLAVREPPETRLAVASPASPRFAAARTPAPVRVTSVPAASAPASAPPAAALDSAGELDNARFLSLERAYADARKNDKVLRGGGPPIPEGHSVPRFEQLAIAFANSVSPDAETPMGARTRYEDADGKIYTAITSYGKKECFMSGPGSRPDGSSRGPMPIKCPASSSSWRKYN